MIEANAASVMPGVVHGLRVAPLWKAMCQFSWAVVCAALIGLAGASAATAQSAEQMAEVEAFADAILLDELLEVMVAEGIAYGDTIAENLFVGDPPREWDTVIEDIYDSGQMQFAVKAALFEALSGDDVAAMLYFLTDDVGARAVALEVSAREARLDPVVEQAADEAAILALADGDPRIDLITRYIEANDLIERNLGDALTANLAFYRGLLEGGGLPEGTGEREILEDVWAQEAMTRTDLTDWYYSYLFMAFAPLSDADIEAYIAFSETPAGRQMNDALFAAFDQVFVEISYALGRAAADALTTSEL